MKYNYMPIHYITLLCLLIFLCNPTYAQNSNASISGTVIDAENKEPVIFATILLLNDKQETLIKSELSQDKGDFSFKNLKSGTYKIKIVHDDYNTFKTEIIT